MPERIGSSKDGLRIFFGFLVMMGMFAAVYAKPSADPLIDAETSIKATTEAVGQAGKTTSFEPTDKFSQEFYEQVHKAVIEINFQGEGCTAFRFDPNEDHDYQQFYWGFAKHCLENIDKNKSYNLGWNAGFGEQVYVKNSTEGFSLNISSNHDVAILSGNNTKIDIGNIGTLKLENNNDYVEGMPALIVGYPGAAQINFDPSNLGKGYIIEIADEFTIKDTHFDADWCHDCIELESINSPQSYGSSGGPVITKKPNGKPEVIGVQIKARSYKDSNNNVHTISYAEKTKYLLEAVQYVR